ncbi:MAG: hypothetical protein M3Q70_00290 [bacterium]|nr:hypothetical protein [bacterium]
MINNLSNRPAQEQERDLSIARHVVVGTAVTLAGLGIGANIANAETSEITNQTDAAHEFVIDTDMLVALGELPTQVCIAPNPNITEGEPGWCSVWGPEDPPTTQPPSTQPPSTQPPSGGGSTGGGSSSGSGGSSGGGSTSGGSSSGGSTSGGSSSGGSSSSGVGGSSSGGETYVAPAPSWNEVIANQYPEKCDDQHSVVQFLNPTEAQTSAFMSAAENPEQDMEAHPEAWSFEYFTTQLEADRVPEAATDQERGSGRLIQLIQECPGLMEPISLSEWQARGYGPADYEAYWAREGQAPTDLELVVFDPQFNITPNTAQWSRTMTMISTVQDRWFAADGATAEQVRAGQA